MIACVTTDRDTMADRVGYIESAVRSGGRGTLVQGSDRFAVSVCVVAGNKRGRSNGDGRGNGLPFVKASNATVADCVRFRTIRRSIITPKGF
jgi:hypothetical protein